MKILKIAMSNDAPALRDVIWAKPVSGGFALYALQGGTWGPLKVTDDKGTVIVGDDTSSTPVFEVKEGTSNGTIKVDGTNIKVHSISTAAYKSEAYFQKAVETGTFAQVPSDPTAGTMYWCTSTMTSTNLGASGVANIPIFYNGSAWVDYLGATVTEVTE